MKHSTFNIQHSTAKGLARLLVLWSVVGGPWSAPAADFTPGYTFSDVETDPNNLVTSNTLAQLVANASARTNLITGRTEATLSATNFWLLTLSTNGTLMKIAVQNLQPSNSIAGSQLASNSIGADRLTSGTLTWTNLSTNWLDGLTLYSNLLVNAPTNGPGTNTFLLSAFSYNTGTNGGPTNLQFRVMPFNSLFLTSSFTNQVNALAATAVTNASTNYYVGTNSSTLSAGVVTFAHGLGVTPGYVRAVALCVVNDGVFPTNTELNVEGIFQNGSSSPNYSVRANVSNVIVVVQGTSSRVYTNTAHDTLTDARWKVKVYARP